MYMKVYESVRVTSKILDIHRLILDSCSIELYHLEGVYECDIMIYKNELMYNARTTRTKYYNTRARATSRILDVYWLILSLC